MQHERKKQVPQSPDVIPGIACMLLMFQAYLVAPLSATLAQDFRSSMVNLAIPAFAIPFAISAAGMVLLKPDADLRKHFLYSLAALCIGTCVLSFTTSAVVFLMIRALTGLGTGAMLPSALLLAIRPHERKRSLNAMVLIIFALATGMTFGPSIGGWLNGLIGWRNLFLSIGMLAATLSLSYFLKDRWGRQAGLVLLEIKPISRPASDWKRRYTYGFVYLTGVFHSGVFVWITYYFTAQYGLDEFHIATDLFIFGLPGFIVAILMFRYQLDKKVITILYAALGLTIAGLLVLMGNLPLWLAECLLGIMSLGFGCSQPLFIGILQIPRAGLSPIGPLAKGSGLLFAGYGSGPLILFALLSFNLTAAMAFLAILVAILAYISRRVWSVSS